MKLVPHTSCLALCLLTHAMAQSPVPGNRNGVRMHGQPATSFLQSFPNYFTGGNRAGDAIYQIYPRRVLTSASGTLELTAVVLPVFVQNQVTGMVELPDVSLLPTRSASGAGATCLVPDLTAPAVARLEFGRVTLPMGPGSAFLVEVGIGGTAQPGIAVPNGDVALAVEATPGEGVATPDSVRLFVSRAGSAVDLAGCGFGAAGVRDAARAETRPLPPFVELWSELAFREPIMFPIYSLDGGRTLDEGFGSLDPPLASGNTTLGWGMEVSQGLGQFAVPFVSVRGTQGTFTLGSQTIRLEPGPFLDLLIVMGQVRLITGNGSPPPSLDGLWRSFQFPLPVDAFLVGTQIHVAAMVFGPVGAGFDFVDASNTCSVRIRP